MWETPGWGGGRVGQKGKEKKSQVTLEGLGSVGTSPLTLRFFFSCQVGTNTVISRCPRFQKYCTAMAMPRHEKKCWRPCLWDSGNEGATSQKTLPHHSSPALRTKQVMSQEHQRCSSITLSLPDSLSKTGSLLEVLAVLDGAYYVDKAGLELTKIPLPLSSGC